MALPECCCSCKYRDWELTVYGTTYEGSRIEWADGCLLNMPMNDWCVKFERTEEVENELVY